MQNNLLIVFSKVSIKGKVKTRLANKFGAKKAKEIHEMLFKHTYEVAKGSRIPFQLYLNEIPVESYAICFKIQQGENLGDRMYNAFAEELNESEKVCIIGSDCHELSPEDINMAFEKLVVNDIVLGPANDGGYYLIGMKKANKDLFAGIIWGSSSVLKNTITKCNQHNLSYFLLPPHNDIDRPEDVPAEWL